MELINLPIEVEQYRNNASYKMINDNFIQKYHMYLNINELVRHYTFTDLSLLGFLCSEYYPDNRLLIRYQTLSIEFINEYILNKDYYDNEEDVGIPEVLYYQKLNAEEIKQLRWKEKK